jgi:hypothetical protein
MTSPPASSDQEALQVLASGNQQALDVDVGKPSPSEAA